MMEPLYSENRPVRCTEFDAFTYTMLVLAVALAIASGIATYSNAGVTRALVACETVRESLPDCMRSKGYVPITGGQPDAPDGWQSEWVRELVRDDWTYAFRDDDGSAE